MKVTEAILHFTYLRQKYTGTVSMFQPADRLMIRVHVETNQKGVPKELVFIFFKLDKGDLFWFDPNNDFRQGMAKVIARKLLE